MDSQSGKQENGSNKPVEITVNDPRDSRGCSSEIIPHDYWDESNNYWWHPIK